MAAVETVASAAPKAPNPTGVAARYALALLGLADDRRATDPGALDRIAADLEKLADLWRGDSTFRAFVADPRLGVAAQRAGGFALLEKAGIGPEVHNLVGVLIANRRLSQLPQVAAAFGAELAARRGQQVADVISAHPLLRDAADADRGATDRSRIFRRETDGAGGSRDPRRPDRPDRLPAL